MELTTRGRYAVMALAELVRQNETRDDGSQGGDASVSPSEVTSAPAVPLPAIAEAQGLPLAYLEQLFGALRRAELISSNRGRAGGYRLVRPARDITVADIMRAVDEATDFTRCHEDHKGCVPSGRCITHDLWHTLGDVTGRFLASVSLEDVLESRFPTHSRDTRAARTEASAKVTGTTSNRRIYFDYNATAPLRLVVREAMLSALDVQGNPSSVHAEGRTARTLIETGRESVAALAGCKPSEVVFTSGATEAISWVMAQPWRAIVTTPVEHDCILTNAHASNAEVHLVAVDRHGLIDIADLGRVLEQIGGGDDVLVSVQAANNETGVMQPLADIADVAREHGARLHCDAAQAPGRLALDFAGTDFDLMSLSAHKLGGPKGIGALIVRDHYDLSPLIRGGGQERRRRAGTENLAGIAGFAAAARLALDDLTRVEALRGLRDRLEAEVVKAVPETVVIAAEAPRLANTSALSLPGRLAEMLVIRLDLAGIAVSAGSACSSGKVGASHVLKAIGIEDGIANSALRVSLGPETTEDEIDAFVATWRDIAERSAMAA